MIRSILILLLLIGLCLTPFPLCFRPRTEQMTNSMPPTATELCVANLASQCGWEPKWVQHILWRDWIHKGWPTPMRVHSGIGPGGP